MHIPTKGFISSILIAKINIYDIHINHIYISTYRILLIKQCIVARMQYVIFLTICILEFVTQPNRRLTLLPVSTDTTQRYEAIAGLTAEARVMYMCVLYRITQAMPALLVILNKTIHFIHFCQCIQYTVHSITTVLLKYAILHENGMNVVT